MKHPHERGEDAKEEMLETIETETPPRAWGRRVQGQHMLDVDGNTPTSVGKTLVDLPGLGVHLKHPHERGEDSVILLDFITQKIGSILVANELQAIQ